jgi:hypothetical protein
LDFGGKVRARRLSRPMCGKARPFRDAVFFLFQAMPLIRLLRQSLEKGMGGDRKAEGFPHIRQQSRFVDGLDGAPQSP